MSCRDGRHQWRSLEEWAQTQGPATREAEGEPALEVDRRTFLKWMGASLALATTACSRPQEAPILPYQRDPEPLIQGQPLYFATQVVHSGYSMGVLVESHMGRPTKVEGNPAHPASLGATDPFTQASVLELWDPGRSRTVVRGPVPSTWEEFVTDLRPRLTGRGSFALMTGAVTSPSFGARLQQFLARHPRVSWYCYEPWHDDNALEGSHLAFGRPLSHHYRIDRAAILLALDADPLCAPGAGVRYAHDFAAGRRPEGAMKRLYAVETTPGLTGAVADHRLAVAPSQVAAVAGAIAGRLGIGPTPAASPLPAPWLDALIDDLLAHRGSSLVMVGERQPPATHALVHAINDRLGNLGVTLVLTAPVELRPQSHLASLTTLAGEMRAGRVETLLLLGINPLYDAPADLAFAEALAQVETTVHHGLFRDETAGACRWHLPATHTFEAWGDGRAFDGTVTLQQPLIAPLYDSRTPGQLLALLEGESNPSDFAQLQDYWRSRHRSADFERWWEESLRAGVVSGSALPPLDVKAAASKGGPTSPPSPIEAIFAPDPTVGDGRWARNPWLQELPKPLTRLVWENAALLAPSLAEQLGLKSGDEVELRLDGRVVAAPVWVLPGHADGAVTLPLGYGRREAGPLASGRGFDAYRLRTSHAPWYAPGLQLFKTGRSREFISLQGEQTMEGRDLVRHADLATFRAHPSFARRPAEATLPTLYSPFPYNGYRWGMSIDLGACVGCGACVVACQAENNIPSVGPEMAAMRRTMHWLRIDRYYEGEPDDPQSHFQPVPCMQCENAPCEPVCPVEASIHDSEGINVQVYNRCVGTRFCSNNCPYKVRRFNYLQYTSAAPHYAAQRNPEVTVRMRGVMEKCNYCLQRIAAARIQAEIEGRRIRDGEYLTACQATCPTRAIVVGDMNDPGSAVNRAKASPLDYPLLAQLNTRPRTTYRAKVTNPNPRVAGGANPAKQENL